MSDCLDNRAKYGLGLIEAGARDFKTWGATMREHLGVHFTDGDLQRIWNEARIEYNERMSNGNTIRTKEAPFIDDLVQRLGSRASAAKFIGHIQESDGSNPLWDKIVDGKEELTSDELKRAAEARNIALAEKAKPAKVPNNQGPLRDIFEVARQMRVENSRAAARGANVEKVPVNAFMTKLRAKLGPDRANDVRQTLAVNGQDTILRKIATGATDQLTAAERLKANQVFANASHYEPPTKSEISETKQALADMRGTARDAAADEIGRATTIEDNLREWAFKRIGAEKYPAFSDDLSKVKPGDYAGMVNVIGKYTKEGHAQSWFALWRAGLISSPLIIPKVVISQFAHFAASELARAPASGLDALIARGTGNRAVYGPRVSAFANAIKSGATQGIEGAKVIMKEGDFGLHARGMHVGPDNADIVPEEFHGQFGVNIRDKYVGADNADKGLSSAVQAVGRMHAASYYPGKVAFNDRALAEQAEIQARKELKAGTIHESNLNDRIEQLKNNPTPEMEASAGQQSAEGTFLNKNPVSGALSAAKHFGDNQKPGSYQAMAGHAIGGILNWAAPIAKVPFNLIAKSVGEYTLGLPTSLVELAVRKASATEMPEEVQRAISMRFGRGTIGALLCTAGIIAKEYWPSSVIPPNARHYDKGGIKVGHFNVATGNIEPTVTPFELGTVYDDALHGDATAKTAMADSVFATIGDLPGFDTIDSIKEALGSPDALKKFAALQAASTVPGAVKAIANYTDSGTFGGEHYRKVEKGHTLEYVEKGVPILREHIPLASEN